MMDKEKRFLENARQVLDDSIHDLDSGTRSRLTQARNAALDARLQKQRKRRRLLAWGTPAVGLAAAVLVGVMVFRGPQPSAEAYVADFDILSSEESLDFYEDIEFYEWLAEGVDDEEISGDGRSNVAPVAARDGECGGRGRKRVAKHRDAGIPSRVRG